MTAASVVRIGCAGWSLPRHSRDAFPADGTQLERYACIFNATEINSSFYRPHRRETYARWAASVPDDFRFSIKAPREISHERRLKACAKPLTRFLGEIEGLGPKLGVVLVQLPPSLAFERRTAKTFLALLRRHFPGAVVLEPRHVSWFDDASDDVLRAFAVDRAGSDPAVCEAAAIPRFASGITYRRLHGSPRMYYSDYSEHFLERLADEVAQENASASESWCIFDNTAHGHAIPDALRLMRLVGES